MKNLKNDIKTKNFSRVYLFFGEESFLIESYEKQLREAVVAGQMEMMNLEVFEGKDFAVSSVINAAETAPFMSDYRLLILKDTGLFATGRKDETEKMADFLPNIPDSTVLVFIESKVDKRSRLYKKLAECGRAVDFASPPEKELIEWVRKIFDKSGKKISAATAMLLLRMVSGDMQQVMNEAQKLIAYKAGDTEISNADVENVCTKSLETKIFDLVAAVGNKKPEVALDIFSNLVLMKESPIMVISMIARQFRLILQCKALKEMGAESGEMASTLGIRGFVVREYLGQSKNFTEEGLILALKDCLNADLNIKTGKMNDRLAVEMLIIRCSGDKYVKFS